MWLQGNFLAPIETNKNIRIARTEKFIDGDKLPVTISSLQIMQTVSVLAKSSAVASGYNVFRLRMARRERITSLSAFLNDLFHKITVCDMISKTSYLPHCQVHRSNCKQG
jgi:hypothetical protein